MKRILLALLFICPPVYAEAPQNTNIAGPTATATGNVTNQAVQVLQGPYPLSQFGGGVACPGPAMTIAPFATGNLGNSTDPFSYQNNSANAGITVGFSTPLNGSITEECLNAARAWTARQQAETDKARLDFELVRAIKCGEMMRQGIRFHPQSPYARICADIIVINTASEPVRNETPVSQGQGAQVPAANKRPIAGERPRVGAR